MVYENSLHNSKKRYIKSKASRITPILTKKVIYIHGGKLFHKRLINRWMVGYRFGEFVWTRKVAIYKVKQQKKKI